MSTLDAASRHDLTDEQWALLEPLATADAFASFGLSQRAAVWAAGGLAGVRPGQLGGTTPDSSPGAAGDDAGGWQTCFTSRRRHAGRDECADVHGMCGYQSARSALRSAASC